MARLSVRSIELQLKSIKKNNDNNDNKLIIDCFINVYGVDVFVFNNEL